MSMQPYIEWDTLIMRLGFKRIEKLQTKTLSDHVRLFSVLAF